MLLPDNIHPEESIYYNASFVLKILLEHGKKNLLDLYQLTKNLREMSFPVFALSLDWLFLLNIISLNEHKEIILCF
jgi:hypothetical protein